MINKPRTSQISFTVANTQAKEIFLEHALNLCRDRYIHVETRENRISLQIQGDRNLISELIDKLNQLSINLEDAFTQRQNKYHYSRNLLKISFKRELRLDYIVQVLNIFGHEAELEDNNIASDIEFTVFADIYKKALAAQDLMQSDQHRDMNRFFAILHLMSGKGLDELITLCTIAKIIEERSGKFHLTMPFTGAISKFKDKIGEKKVNNPIIIPKEENQAPPNFFDGGKLIFVKNGEELEHSPFVSLENLEDEGEKNENRD